MNKNLKEKSNSKNFLIGMNHQNKKNNLKSGFTLVELLITITIFVIVTGVVLVNSNKFDSSVLLNNFAYDVALTIKQAQSYGVNVRESTNIFDTTPNADPNFFNTAYGVYFDIGPGGSKSNFVLFNDTMNESEYNTGALTRTPDHPYNGNLLSCPVDDYECIQKYSIKRGTIIEDICAVPPFPETECQHVDQLSILFKRPSLAAQIYYTVGANPLTPSNYAKITLAAEDGTKQYVVVTSVGQIYVQKKQ